MSSQAAPTKERDFAATVEEHPEQLPAQQQVSDSDLDGTDSSEEFDWDEDDGETKPADSHVSKARRLRWLYQLFMKLARPVRTLLLGIVGTGILLTPLLVFELRFKSNRARPQVHAWSLWLAVIWAAACLTSIVIDNLTRFIIALIVLFGGQVERLKIQLELTLAVKNWLKLLLDVAWAWISLSVIRGVYHPAGSYWIIVNRVMQVSCVFLLESFSSLTLTTRLYSPLPLYCFVRRSSCVGSPSTSIKKL